MASTARWRLLRYLVMASPASSAFPLTWPSSSRTSARSLTVPVALTEMPVRPWAKLVEFAMSSAKPTTNRGFEWNIRRVSWSGVEGGVIECVDRVARVPVRAEEWVIYLVAGTGAAAPGGSVSL